MNHLHFETIPSTHTYLKDNIELLLKNDSNILISCDHQTNGIGRTGNAWLHNQNSIAFSCTITPCQNLTLTPIELGVIICRYFAEKFKVEIKLKWPNDLMNPSLNKVGGLITNFHSTNIILVGIGINIGSLQISLKHARYQIGSINVQAKLSSKDWCADIYQYILNHRMNVEDILNEFKKLCAHFQKEVSIIDNGLEYTGVFQGCNSDGAAIITINGSNQTFISGSLTILN